MSLLERCVPFEIRSADDSGDGLTLEGYAAVFNTPTRIDSWEGTFDEVIARGAFAKTIREGRQVMQFDHGRHPMVGSIPIGSITTLREDEQGLYVSARLADNWLTQPVRDAIANQSIQGMSFRFEPIKESWRYADGKPIKRENLYAAIHSADPANPPQRTLQELRCPELGPVVFPAYAETSVDVRGLDPTLAALVRALPDNVRADMARLLNGTSETPSEAAGASDDDEAARTEEPGDHSADLPGDAERLAASRARIRALKLRGLIT